MPTQRVAEKCRKELRLIALMLLATLTAPLTAQPNLKIFAQQLVMETLAQHAEVAHVVMHVTPPHHPDTDNVIIASNIGRIGKRADDDDLRILRTGALEAVVSKGGDRFNVSLPFLDAPGNTIGVLAIGFPYKPGDDTQALTQRAKQLRNALRKRIPAVEKLFESV